MSKEEFNKEELADEILLLQEDIEVGYSFWETTRENRQVLVSKFAALLDMADRLKQSDPVFYSQFEKTRFNGKHLLMALGILNEDLREGFGKVIEKVSSSVNETVISMAKHFKTNDHYAWQNKNPSKEVAKAVGNFAEDSQVDKLLKEFLPSVKAEEMSDLLAFALSGKLSSNYENISSLEDKDQKITLIKQLMAQERLHIKVDFSKLSITDETERLKQEKGISKFSARGIASKSMIDSAFLSEDGTELVCVCSTANKDTSTQKDQLYRIFHTLNEMSNKGNLHIAGVDNPKINLVFYNRALFCTEDKDDVFTKVSLGPKGGTKKVSGFHHASSRSEFENLIESGKDVSKFEMDVLNGLVTLSIVGNDLNYPRFPYTFEISDLVNANPFTVGADTLWLKEKFEEIREFTGVEREQKFFEFMVDYTNDVMMILDKLKPGTEISKDNVQNTLIKNFTESLNRTISGMANNFTSYNLGKNYVEENAEVFEKIAFLKKRADHFNKKHPNTKITISPIRALMDNEVLLEEGENILNARKIQEESFCKTWNNLIENENVKKTETKSLREVLLSFSMEVIKSEDNPEGSIQKLHEELDFITKELYQGIPAKGKQTPIYKYLLASASGLMSLNSKENKKEALESLNNNNFYKKINDICGNRSAKRKFFKQLVKDKNEQIPGSAKDILAVDGKILEFMNKLSSNEGAMDIINSGGYEFALNKLVQSIKTELRLTANNHKLK